MVQKKKFRGVRQRHWGSWVSEIRHPLLKRRVWLGTFDTAQEAAIAYDQAAILMSGRNAKTNFPVPQQTSDDGPKTSYHQESSLPSTKELSEILHSKLRKSSKAPSPSLTCLRLDIENSHIGVWQKRAGPSSDSNWVMTVELHKENGVINGDSKSDSSSSSGAAAMSMENERLRSEMEEEQRIALQMIEEFLDLNTTASPDLHGNNLYLE